MTEERNSDIEFANTVNTSFSYTFFHLLYKNSGKIGSLHRQSFDDVVTQFCLNFLSFLTSGV